MPATVKIVERQPLSFLARTYLPGVIAGLRTTLRHMLAPKITMEYPEVRPPIPVGYRGVPTLVKDTHTAAYAVTPSAPAMACPGASATVK